MSAAELARKVMRDVRNRWSYEEVENFVRDATSNTSDPPNPKQIRHIADAMLYYDTYPKAFAMLWRRLTHLEYKRHVAKALLVLDSLVRIRPPSKAVQLRLMVDIRERWPEIYRLAKLRPSSSSETIAQIQRVAEKLCAFIMGYESGYILPQEEEQGEGDEDADEDDEEEEKRRTRRVKRRKKKRTTIEEEEEEQEEGAPPVDEPPDDGGGGDESDGDIDHHLPPSAPEGGKVEAAPSASLPPVSPFGFDFFQHHNFDWAPPPAAAPSAAPPAQTPLTPATWACRQCTFHNAAAADKCEICGGARYLEMEDEVKQEEEKVEEGGGGGAGSKGWECLACSFINREEMDHCEVCDTRRGSAEPVPGETGGERGPGYGGEGEVPGEGGEDEKEGVVEGTGEGVPGHKRSIGGSQLPGAWACSYCSWLNPPTATHCEVCEREGKKSDLAQLVKLEIARKYQEQQGEGGEAPADGKQPWSCSVCTFVNVSSTPPTLHPLPLAPPPSHSRLPSLTPPSICVSVAVDSRGLRSVRSAIPLRDRAPPRRWRRLLLHLRCPLSVSLPQVPPPFQPLPLLSRRIHCSCQTPCPHPPPLSPSPCPPPFSSPPSQRRDGHPRCTRRRPPPPPPASHRLRAGLRRPQQSPALC